MKFCRSAFGFLMVMMLVMAAHGQSTNLSLSPLPDDLVPADELMISVSVSGPLVDTLALDRAKLFVDDRDVTGLCLRTDRFLSYRPMSPPSPGVMQARLEFPNGVVRSWSFKVGGASALVEAISHSAEDSLGEYEELVVTMNGAPGLKAGFLVGPDDDEHPMLEQHPGLYVGTYTVQPGDYYLGEPIIGQIHKGTRIEKLEAKEPVTLFGHLFRVVILSPASGSQVPNNFDIRGRTRPGSRVSLVPNLSFRKNSRAPNTETGRGSSFDTKADENGYFEVNYGVPLSLPNLSVVLSIFAVTPDGERSVPVIVRYHF